MKHALILFLITITQYGYSQNTHRVTVNINQPESCLITDIKFVDIDVNLYPNPADHSINISASQPFEFSILDTTGRLVLVKSIPKKHFAIDVSNYQPGIYHCVIKHASGTKYSKIVIK